MLHPRPPLPGVLADIAEVAGVEAALAIATARGGTEIYVPPVPGADHWITRLVGADAALAIATLLTCGQGNGMRIELPLGPTGHAARQRAMVDSMIAENRSELEIARATGYTIRTVRRRRARLGRVEDDRQFSLL